MRPLLSDPAASVHEEAFTQARRGANAEFWGRTIRTACWRCTDWDEGRNGVELCDHDKDPQEFTNLAEDQRHAGVLKDLRARLAETVPTMGK